MLVLRPLAAQFGRLVEVSGSTVTHYHARTDSLSAIDRVFTLSRIWLIPQLE